MYLNLKAYLNHLLRPKWMILKLPLEFKSDKHRAVCLNKTTKHIIDHTKIIS
jgi:hypothetical protein